MQPRRTKQLGVRVGMNRGNLELEKEKQKERDEGKGGLPPLPKRTELFAQFPGKSGSNLWNWLVLMFCSKAEFRVGFWVGRGTEASW